MNAEIRFKDKRLLEALEYIDEKYIDDVFDFLKEPAYSKGEQTKISSFKRWRHYLAAAACLLVLALAMPLFTHLPEIINSFAAGWGDGTEESTDRLNETTERPRNDSSESSNVDMNSQSVELTDNPDYLRFIPELEEIDNETMLNVKSAWAEFKRNGCYTSNYQNYLYLGYTDNEAKALAEKDANRAAENAFPQFFDALYFYYYGYLGTINDSIVLASYSGAGQPINGLTIGGVDFGFRARFYVYTDGKITSLEEAYENDLVSSEELILIKMRNEQYIESAYDYYVKQFEQFQNGKEQ
ncbi:MAG: hypothetical protein IJY97_01950 [Clostridia bacterium]|nr:hypothetical protein [Clostridia bacterium]